MMTKLIRSLEELEGTFTSQRCSVRLLTTISLTFDKFSITLIPSCPSTICASIKDDINCRFVHETKGCKTPEKKGRENTNSLTKF